MRLEIENYNKLLQDINKSMYEINEYIDYFSN